MSRPTKLTPYIHSEIIKALSVGSTIVAACHSVNISYNSYNNWMKRGEAELERRANPKVKSGSSIWKREQPYVEFFEAATHAQGKGMVVAAMQFKQGMMPHDVETVTTKTITETRIGKDGTPYEYKRTETTRTVAQQPGDWRAAMEYLARRDPEHWARQAPQRIEHTGADGNALEIKIVYTNDDD